MSVNAVGFQILFYFPKNVEAGRVSTIGKNPAVYSRSLTPCTSWVHARVYMGSSIEVFDNQITIPICSLTLLRPKP